MRWISMFVAAAVCVVAITAFVAAQDDKPVRLPLGSKTQLPFEVIVDGGKRSWRIHGRGTIKVEDLVGGLASVVGKRVVYSRYATEQTRNTLTYVAPDEGVVVTTAEIPLYVSDLLASSDLTLTGFSTPTLRVVRLAEAHEYATALEGNSLDGLDESDWASMLLYSERSNGNQLADMWRDFGRSGRYYMRASGHGVLLSGRVDALRQMMRLISQADREGASGEAFVRSYSPPAGINAADAKRALDELFTRTGSTVTSLEGKYIVKQSDQTEVSVALSPGGNKLLVRANTKDHKSVEAALAAMAK